MPKLVPAARPCIQDWLKAPGPEILDIEDADDELFGDSEAEDEPTVLPVEAACGCRTSPAQVAMGRDVVATSVLDDGARVLALPTDAEEIVTITGSLLGGRVYGPGGNQMLPALVAAMLDKGTVDEDKFAISQALEDVGARISFSADTYRVRFSAKCLRAHVPLVLGLLARQLREPAFDAADLKTVKRQFVTALARDRNSVGAQANIALFQRLYPAGHPSYVYDLDTRMDWVRAVDADALRAFHAANYGLGNLTVVGVGDLDVAEFTASVAREFSGWTRSPLTLVVPDAQALELRGPEDVDVRLRDKQSTILEMGQAVGISRDHPDYNALRLATFILGGNFSARLMQTVRDTAGLTYGIRSRTGGGDDGGDGYFVITGTFAPSLLARGEALTKQVLSTWIAEKVTALEVARKKETLVGGYKVSLDSTGALAAQLLDNSERGKPVDFIDTYPTGIATLTLDQVNHAIQTYMDPDRLVVVRSGTFAELDSETVAEL